MNGLFHLLTVLQTQAAGHRHVDAAADADQKAREQGHQQRGGAYRAQRQIVGKLSGDGHVAEVEQYLQHLRQHQGQTEQQNILPQRACGHFNGMQLLFPCHSQPSCL